MKSVTLACIFLAGCNGAYAPVPRVSADDREERSAQEPKPSVWLVDEVERRISRLFCVGTLARWRRDYRYDFRPKDVDKTKVLFVLIGTGGMSDRRISQPRDTYNVPAGKYRLVAGVFNTNSRTVIIEQCGDVVDGSIPSQQP